MTYRMFIDDIRDPPDGQWVVVRSSEEAILYVKDHGVPSFISFDHDLGGDDTSIIFIDWLFELCLDLEDLGVDKKLILFPRDYAIHSQNPVGAKNIDGRMKSFIMYLG